MLGFALAGGILLIASCLYFLGWRREASSTEPNRCSAFAETGEDWEYEDGNDGGSLYRARHDPRRSHLWDPYDESQSRSHRTRERKRRPASKPGQPDYYALLGLDRAATDVQVERAYRSQVALIHPDRFLSSPDQRRAAESRLRELNRAMEVLRDPLRRARYDATH